MKEFRNSDLVAIFPTLAVNLIRTTGDLVSSPTNDPAKEKQGTVACVGLQRKAEGIIYCRDAAAYKWPGTGSCRVPAPFGGERYAAAPLTSTVACATRLPPSFHDGGQRKTRPFLRGRMRKSFQGSIILAGIHFRFSRQKKALQCAH